MLASPFDYTQFDRGKKYTFDLGPILNGMLHPVLLARGKRPGKVLVVTAGVRGDEYEGVRAILDVFAALSPADVSGDFLAVPRPILQLSGAEAGLAPRREKSRTDLSWKCER